MEVRQALGGRYTLLSELGNGGMAVVWRARDEVLGRPVAVKVLAGRFAGDPQSRARIRDEARAAATLSHPNIAQVYDYGEADDLPYVVMELVNGPTLQQRVASGPLPPRTIFRICGEVAAALAVAHEDGLVHRDIKMANIMIAPSGVKVVDFGIAAVAGPAAPEEKLVGTPAYLAPERLTGDAVEPASDVYALGVLLYRLLAHESPWSVESTTQMLQAHVYVEPEPLPDLPGVPARVADLIHACLRKNPADRPSASQVSATLADAAEAAAVPHPVRNDSEPTAFRVPRPAPPRAEPPRYAARPDAAPRPRSAGATTHPDDEPPRHAVSPGVRLHDEPPRHAVSPGARLDDEPPRYAAEPGPGPDGGPDGGLAGAASSRSTMAEPPATGRANNSAWPATTVDRASRRRLGAVGGWFSGVRRKYVFAGAGVALVIVGALLAWLLGGNPDAAGERQVAIPPTSVAPSVTSAGASPPTPTRGSGPVPAATGRPGPAPIVGSGPVPSVAPSGSSAVAPGVSSAPEPSVSTDVEPTVSTSPPGKKLMSPGGAAFAVCDQGRAALTGFEPAEGFVAQPIEPGPAISARVVFTGEKSTYRMAVTCVGQIPTPVVLPL